MYLLINERPNLPKKSADFIDPIDISKEYDGLNHIKYETPLVDFVDVKAYLRNLEKREVEEEQQHYLESVAIENSKWEWYDQLKDTDVIEKPYFYNDSYPLTPKERDLVERTVMHEAGWCPDYRLLILTAQCFRNDCETNGDDVFTTYSRCGYAAMSYANPRAKKAVTDVFDKKLKCVDENIICYYNSNVMYSADHERHNLAINIDGNRFFY